MIMVLIAWLLLLPLLLIRGLRWLAIVQQKEYRWDRLRAFLQSSEGRADLIRVWPRMSDFTRQGLKRPVITGRVIVVLLVSIKLSLVMLFSAPQPATIHILLLTGIYLLLPIVIMIAILPSAMVSRVLTYLTLFQAQRKLLAHRPTIIGITGSYGKTSTKLLLAHVLSRKFSVFFTPRSFNTRYSVARSIVTGYRGQEIALLEYGAYTRGEIKFLARWFPPTMAVVTGLAPQHLELFGSVENIIKAKSELPLAIPDGQAVFCNAADEGALRICSIAKQAAIKAYTGAKSSVAVTEMTLSDNAQLSFVWKGHRVVTHLVGCHYLANVQAAIAVAEHFGMSETEIVQALASFQPPAQFIQLKQSQSGAVVIDDGGTTNPTGFSAALDILRWFRDHQSARKRVLITAGIVDLGAMSDEIHTQLARQAESLVDEVWYVGSTGRDNFKSVFGERQRNDITEIKTHLAQIADDTLLVIEGKVPQWVYHAINI